MPARAHGATPGHHTSPVTVVILHPEPPDDAGPLERAVACARRELADRHAVAFEAAGASTTRVVAGPPDGQPFGPRLRDLVATLPDGSGLVVLGSGAVPLIAPAERRMLVATAGGGPGAPVLTNNRYSADVIAIPDAAASLAALPNMPDLATDNGLPRWLAETAGMDVRDLRRRWRLGVDIDTAMDLALLGGDWARHLPADVGATISRQLTAIRGVAADPRAELHVAGRTSAAALAWLECHTAARTRALVEERGFRTSPPGQRPPASVLGLLLDRDGPAAFGPYLARLGDGAIVDTRVLLAHRYGPDEAAWPSAEDRFASDLLLHDRITDAWLRDLTASVASAPIPILLGGHTLVGPGLRLALGASHGGTSRSQRR